MAEGLFYAPQFRISGDRMLLVAFGDVIDLRVNEKVHAMTALLRKNPPQGLESVVPAYRSLALVYDPILTGPPALKEVVLRLAKRSDRTDIPVPSTVDIPVCYGGDFGPDIQFVADHNHLSVQDVITIHTGEPYHIYAIGFAPGFCYLGGLDKRLHAPRLETPRTNVPAGSVGIAEAQTGIYPLNSPGGWRLIGRTPLKLFDARRDRPVLYQAGDSLRFVAISPEEYRRFREEAGP
jgi:inhibitor of KinA